MNKKIILNLQNNLEHKPITAGDIPGVNRIGLLPDDTIHFEYDPIKVYGNCTDMLILICQGIWKIQI